MWINILKDRNYTWWVHQVIKVKERQIMTVKHWALRVVYYKFLPTTWWLLFLSSSSPSSSASSSPLSSSLTAFQEGGKKIIAQHYIWEPQKIHYYSYYKESHSVTLWFISTAFSKFSFSPQTPLQSPSSFPIISVDDIISPLHWKHIEYVDAPNSLLTTQTLLSICAIPSFIIPTLVVTAFLFGLKFSIFTPFPLLFGTMFNQSHITHFPYVFNFSLYTNFFHLAYKQTSWNLSYLHTKYPLPSVSTFF